LKGDEDEVMNPRRRRHNKHARALRRALARYRGWIRFREERLKHWRKDMKDVWTRTINECVRREGLLPPGAEIVFE
jgi:hypothetical protein